jgi:thioredoxin 1
VAWLWRAAVVLAVVAAVAVIMARKHGRDTASDSGNVPPVALAASHTAPGTPGIPRLVDVGADRCIPCKAMAPILAELRTEYAGRMHVEFIDVWKDPEAGDPYRVTIIPTQIFYAGDGRELERHQGFISKADILATWQRHGYDFSAPGAPASQN